MEHFDESLCKKEISNQIAEIVNSEIKKNFRKSKIISLDFPNKSNNGAFGCKFAPNENSLIKEEPIQLVINSDHETNKRVLRLLIFDPMTGIFKEKSDKDSSSEDDVSIAKKELHEIKQFLDKDLEKIKILHDRAA